jgi:putative Mn2+ efflux pump MntP
VRACLSKGQTLNLLSFLTSIPLILFWLGLLFGNLIKGITKWDHQGLLVFVLVLTGLRLFIKAFRSSAEERAFDLRNIKVLLFVSFALGMNAFIIGSGLSFIEFERPIAYLIFSICSLSLSALGVYMGKKFGNYDFGSKAELLGAFLLVGLGVKLALQWFQVI